MGAASAEHDNGGIGEEAEAGAIEELQPRAVSGQRDDGRVAVLRGCEQSHLLDLGVGLWQAGTARRVELRATAAAAVVLATAMAVVSGAAPAIVSVGVGWRWRWSAAAVRRSVFGCGVYERARGHETRRSHLCERCERSVVHLQQPGQVEQPELAAAGGDCEDAGRRDEAAARE